MPRLRNRKTGAVVNVSDETAERLGETYEAADKKSSSSSKGSTSSKSSK